MPTTNNRSQVLESLLAGTYVDRNAVYTGKQLNETLSQKVQGWGDLGIQFDPNKSYSPSVIPYTRGSATNTLAGREWDPSMWEVGQATRNEAGQWVSASEWSDFSGNNYRPGQVIDSRYVDQQGRYGGNWMMGRGVQDSVEFGRLVEKERAKIQERERPKREAEASHAAQQRRWRALGGSVASRQATRGTILTSPSGVPGTATFGGFGGGTLLGGGDRLGT